MFLRKLRKQEVLNGLQSRPLLLSVKLKGWLQFRRYKPCREIHRCTSCYSDCKDARRINKRGREELFSSELDPDRTNQRGNRIPPTRQTVSIGSTNSEPLKGSPKIVDSNGDNNSIGPNESASYPTDARTQSQLAIKALIHNLRLDEKESVHRAKQLEAVEAEMKAKDQSGLNDSPDAHSSTVQTTIKPQPLASSPETWGKSFKVEWIKVYPISFSSVRRLRNPWRDDRQIKVSRDGTELEPNVGRQLLDEWRKAEKEGNNSSKISIASGNADEEEEEEDDG
ncbi:hypothetical protein L7F22_043788 [Adiantum nelumboides]|nr:hypothetical protein [Adiantum nelumboides]